MKMTIRYGASHNEVTLNPGDKDHRFDLSPLSKSERREFARQVVATLFPGHEKGGRRNGSRR